MRQITLGQAITITITIAGASNASKVLVQLWESNKVLVTMDEVIVVDGKINATMYTGKTFKRYIYTLKVADSTGGVYEQFPLNILSNSDLSGNKNWGGGGTSSTIITPGTNEDVISKVTISAEAFGTALNNVKNGIVTPFGRKLHSCQCDCAGLLRHRVECQLLLKEDGGFTDRPHKNISHTPMRHFGNPGGGWVDKL